jgi:exonuclease SbcC
LQGKADQFTQKKAGERKAVLSTILGLEIWDTYKDRTAEKRRQIEIEVQSLDGRVAEIEAELGEEDARRSRLAELEENLKQLSSTRAAQESALENIKKNAAQLDQQRKLAVTLSKSLERARSDHASLETRLAQKESEGKIYSDLLSRAKEIESSYQKWQNARAELEELDKAAAEFREHEKEREPLQKQIAVAKATLEEEQRALLIEQEEIGNQEVSINDLKAGIESETRSLLEVEGRISERTELEKKRNEARERQAAIKAENEALKENMSALKERIESLKAANGATCPLCGQDLTEKHRKATLKQLEEEGRQKGDRFRANKAELEKLEMELEQLASGITKTANLDQVRLKHSNTISQLTERIESLQSVAKEWERSGRKRLAQLTRELEKESFAADARKQLLKLDRELAKLGYDASAHDRKRKQELELRKSGDEYQNLDKARAVTRQIENEIASLGSEIRKRKTEILEQENSYNVAAQALAESEALSPDVHKAERDLFSIREDENRTRDQAGAARQKVEVLSTLRTRKADYLIQRDELNQQIVRHKTLERAFGRDGVPALLIEQALPQIEQKANDLLDRLSDGHMSIRFVTQAEYKDKKRDDLKETLDIQISDSAGLRDYEMYSGGEAFRVNFAIRLALSEILAQRKGARLQTLVIDEGFGSQDVQGRQRLIEAINLVKNDFAKILVITHLDELKDAFPNRIEVEKTERGSTVKVM